jgi:hypothetical protein
MPIEQLLLNFSTAPSFHAATFGAVCLLLATICLVTRILTGQRSNLDSDDVSEPKDVEVVPYFVPWLGSAISFGLRFQDFLAEAQYVKDSEPFRIS